MENPFEKGASKPFPKLFGLPLLCNGSRCFVMLHADSIVAQIVILLFGDGLREASKPAGDVRPVGLQRGNRGGDQAERRHDQQ